MPRLRPKRSSASSHARRGAGVVGAQPAAAGAQLGRLGFDDRQVLGLGEREVSAAVDLPQLAGADDVGRAADRLAGERRLQRAGQVEGVREQEVADQHAGFVVAAGVDRFAMPAQAGFVQHVVVHQRGGVDHFDHGGQHDVVARDLAGGLGRPAAPAPAAAACRPGERRASPASRRTDRRSTARRAAAPRPRPVRRRSAHTGASNGEPRHLAVVDRLLHEALPFDLERLAPRRRECGDQLAIASGSLDAGSRR